MVTFLKKLFGVAGSGTGTTVVRGEAVQYNGYRIEPAPEAEGSQWRLAGYILRQNEEDIQETKFVRADMFSSREEASEFTVRKGRQIIDEQGDRLFADRNATDMS
ncbi:MAG: HlyU family transcriptional regulator [Pseudomonadota bacterium]